MILALTRVYEGLWLSGTGSLAVLTFTFVNFEVMRQHMTSMMDKDLAGNPFAGLADWPSILSKFSGDGRCCLLVW